MRKIAAVINARLQSTRVPNKVIRPFGDTTLLDIALKKLIDINADEKYLAACEDDILKIYEPYKKDIDLLLRKPESVKKGENPHTVSFEHYSQTKSKWIFIINLCLPFTKVDMYNEAILKFKNDTSIRSATSAIKENNIYFDSEFQPINLRDKDFISSRNTYPIYKMANAYHIINRDYFFKTGKLWDYSDNNPLFIEVNNFDCLDVDTQSEFDFCEKLWTTLE